jgi:hypothetical protein
MNNKKLLIGLGVVAATYAFWRFYLKGKLADKQATKSLNDRAMFDANRELIAQSLPQAQNNETLDIDFENIG